MPYINVHTAAPISAKTYCLVTSIKNTIAVNKSKVIPKVSLVNTGAQSGDIILVLGAGDIYELAKSAAANFSA